MADQWDDVAAALFPDAAHAKPMTMAAAREMAAAALRSAYEQGKRDERDACAQVAEKAANRWGTARDDIYNDGALAAAAAIRSRSTNDASE